MVGIPLTSLVFWFYQHLFIKQAEHSNELKTIVKENVSAISRIQNITEGTIVIDSHSDIPLQTSYEAAATRNYLDLTKVIVSSCRRAVRDLHPDEDLKFIRLQTRKNDILFGLEDDFTAVVVQQRMRPWSKSIDIKNENTRLLNFDITQFEELYSES